MSSQSNGEGSHGRRARKLFVPLEVDYWHNPRIMAVGARAEHLYVRTLCFAKYLQSDGLLTTAQVETCARGIRNWRSLTGKLVEAGLWDTTQYGWCIAGYLERNQSRAEISEVSEERARAGRRGGLRSGESRSNARRTDNQRTANGHPSEPNAQQLASPNPEKETEVAARTDNLRNPETETEIETEGEPPAEERKQGSRDLASRLAFALHANQSPLSEGELAAEAENAVTRALAAGHVAAQVDEAIARVSEQRALWPSDLKEQLPALSSQHSPPDGARTCPQCGSLTFSPGSGWMGHTCPARQAPRDAAAEAVRAID
jgi:hypothetical protein